MTFLASDFLGTPLWFWAAFLALVAAMLALDLGVLHRKQREIGVRESLLMSAAYIAIGLGFGAWLWAVRGPSDGLDYVTGFLVEKSLAMDNVFVIAMIFAYFAVPRIHQHRVLFWGILGVIVLRGVMIGFGSALVENFGWLLYLFAAFLIFTGIKMWVSADKPYEVGNSPILRWIKRRFRVTDGMHEERFFISQPDPATGRPVRAVTPLFLALVMIELADVIFAVDSIPAIFAITTDPFIVYTSNVFAVLGLRALYFALSAMIDRFHYLKHALAVLLVFIGSKVFVADLLGLSKFPPALSLGVTVTILAAGVVYSLIRTAPSKGGGTAKPASD